MARHGGSAIGVILFLSAVLAGCGAPPVVGVLLPSTGAAGAYGESIESGVRLALADSRKHEALPADFEIVWADSGSDPQRAVEQLRTMVDERGVRLVIGGATSGEAQAIIPLLEDIDVVCVSPSASTPGLSRLSPNFFRIYPSDELEGNTAGKFLVDRLKIRKVMLYAGDSDYTHGIEPEFVKQYEEALGGEILERIAITEDGWQQASRAAMRGNRCEAVYIIGYAEQTLEVLRHLADIGFSGRVLATSAFYSSKVIHDAGELAEGLLFSLPPFDRTSEREPVLGFVTRYMDTYQQAPDVFAAHGYDAMRLAVEVLKLAGRSDTLDIRRALTIGLSEFMGVTGPILFDEYGDVKHYPKMFIVKDGQVLSYQRYMQAEKDRIFREVQDLLTSDDDDDD